MHDSVRGFSAKVDYQGSKMKDFLSTLRTEKERSYWKSIFHFYVIYFVTYMLIGLIWLILACCWNQGFSIILSCTNGRTCPDHAYCHDQYCRCEEGYILDCGTRADRVQVDVKEEFVVTEEQEYFYYQPPALDAYYVSDLTICSNDHREEVVNLTLWLDDGQATLQKNQQIGTIELSTENLTKCVVLQTAMVEYETQPNGQTEGIILGLRLKRSDNYTISIELTFTQIADNSTLYIIGIVTISLMGIGVIAVIVYCFWRKYAHQGSRQNKTYHLEMVNNFHKQIPFQKYSSVGESLSQNCTICLGDFSPDDQVRLLPCGHLFHQHCIDAWCTKNLNCPVCRLDLDEATISMKKKEKENQIYRNISVLSIKGNKQEGIRDFIM